jgi:hypothetical protein
MVAMPLVRPTLFSNLALLEDKFVHGYWEGAAVFYLSTTNEGGQTDKVTDEENLSFVPGLRDLKGVKFSVCGGNHWRQV